LKNLLSFIARLAMLNLAAEHQTLSNADVTDGATREFTL
jgi:hypothetical protein